MTAVMHTLGPQWLNPDTLLNQYGLWVALIVVFVECGLLFPFLPGDSLLFTVGVLIASGTLHLNAVVAAVIFSIAAFVGNVVGYEIGRLVGPPIFNRDGRILKRDHVDKTHAFFDRYGNRSLVLGRFVPIVRTFITLVAGVGRMDRGRFLTWSAVGAALWATGVIVLGILLGGVSLVRDHIETVLMLIIIISVIPMALEYLRRRRQSPIGP